MVYVKYCGRLGNQFFQLATGLALALENNDEVIAPPADFYKFINFKPQPASFVQYSKLYTEPNFHYDKIPYEKNILIAGYFQSEKYFIDKKEEVFKALSLRPEYEEQIKNKYKDILNQETISIHVRRTDYVNNEDNHPLQPIEYYTKALDYIGTKDKKVLVFSDDISWCKSKFIGEKFIFIENNLNIVDLFLMSYCKHNIIANSSFSWWGAWLNTNPDKIVVAPSKWFGPLLSMNNTKDIYCDGWHRI